MESGLRRGGRRTARGINTINTRRCVELFVTLGLRPRKANASAKHVKDCRWGVAAPRRGEGGAGRPTTNGDTPHMRPDEGRKYPDPEPLIHVIHSCLAACRADDTHSPARPRFPVSTSKSIRRMRSVQDSVLPWGCGGEASPHFLL